MNFLVRLQQFWKRIFQRSENLPPDIQPDERLSRYILSKRWLKKSNSAVSPSVFLPAPRTHDTSVYRTTGCLEHVIWELGDRFVTALHPERKPVLGRADLPAYSVFQCNLRVVPWPEPHPRHANITDWPGEPALALMKATELANQARLIIRP